MKKTPIYDDPILGKGILCQIGNPEDLEWCRQAEAIVLDASKSLGQISYTCVAKKTDGTLLILFDVELREDETGFCTHAYALNSPRFDTIPRAAQIRSSIKLYEAAVTGNLFPFQWEQRTAA